MERIDFAKLRVVVNRPGSSNVNVKNSKDCYPEYNSLLSNYIVKHNSFNEKESALHTMSMQNWVMKKEVQTASSKVDVGQIWLADLGSNYKPESSYTHPVVVLELIGNMVYVVPCTTSPTILANAFHPTDNPSGNMFYRKVGIADGFGHDCTIVLSNVRSISKGRLLGHKGNLNNINHSMSLFSEIKNKCLEFCFPKQHIAFLKAQKRVQELETANLELLDRIKILEDEKKDKEEAKGN